MSRWEEKINNRKRYLVLNQGSWLLYHIHCPFSFRLDYSIENAPTLGIYSYLDYIALVMSILILLHFDSVAKVDSFPRDVCVCVCSRVCVFGVFAKSSFASSSVS
jgi:hypothetical protein